MSRWYDQHRIEKRMRRLERDATTHRLQTEDVISILTGDIVELHPGGTTAAVCRQQQDADALDAREQAPAFRSDSGSASHNAAQRE